ncbi:39S ribosomal protein L47, mitochondrial [Perkinsus olseni]|uniref:Large ribosomal subunit protein uL29m n=1 Tax=Perkinsus olseni TaxID=32597 RepID=A0A7J6KTN2_PEROL|nr:39S ribosomal protein L47, mitochondrial [Perkinsus olseni]KAF4651635.1 39S ribosomal protein L47, mitochondrial [Perkinsus olseni]
MSVSLRGVVRLSPLCFAGQGGITQFWKGGHLDPDLAWGDKEKNCKTGDAWPACLLRLKSFDDLHKLWYYYTHRIESDMHTKRVPVLYICLKEKNFLMSERAFARAHRTEWSYHGRLKKVKMTMKRILTVLSRREIHQQTIRAKEMRDKQQLREELETRRFHIEEQMLKLKHRIERMGDRTSLMRNAWETSLKKYEEDHNELLMELRPLRKDTMQMLVPNWRYATKYSDIPGNLTWRRQWVRALEEAKKNFARYH